MFFWKVPVTIIAWVVGTAALGSSLRVVRYGVIPLTFAAFIVRGNYKKGEGPLTERFFGSGVHIDRESKDPLGLILAQLGTYFDILPKGLLYEMTVSEAEDLRLLLVAVVKHPAYARLGMDESAAEELMPSIQATKMYLDNFPESRIREA